MSMVPNFCNKILRNHLYQESILGGGTSAVDPKNWTSG